MNEFTNEYKFNEYKLDEYLHTCDVSSYLGAQNEIKMCSKKQKFVCLKKYGLWDWCNIDDTMI